MKPIIFERNVKKKVFNGTMMFCIWLNSILTVLMVFAIETFEAPLAAYIVIAATIIFAECCICYLIYEKVPSDFYYEAIVTPETVAIRESGKSPIVFNRHYELSFTSETMMVSIKTEAMFISPQYYPATCYHLHYDARFRRFLEEAQIVRKNIAHSIFPKGYIIPPPV